MRERSSLVSFILFCALFMCYAFAAERKPPFGVVLT
jgi:hypothetical protein